MSPRAFFYAATALVATIGISGCTGGGASTPAAEVETHPSSAAAIRPDAATQTVAAAVGAAAATTMFALANGVRASLTLRSAGGTGNLMIDTSAPAWSTRTASSHTCPTPSPIVISNPFPFPIVVDIDSFKLRLPCSVDGVLFGASAYQSKPMLRMLVSTKLGDAKGRGRTISFRATVAALTFPPKTSLTISVLPEASTAFTQLPAVANAEIGLTSGAPQVPNSLALSASSVSGGSTFQSACYLPGDPAGPGLGGAPVLGTPSFYCVLVPGQTGTSTTFGTNGSNSNVSFTLGPNAKPDLSYVQLDGPSIFAPCAPAGNGQTCPAQPFSLPVYSKAIVGNVADIAVCVPATENADCNGVAGNAKAASVASVPVYTSFQLLVADDATYNLANTFGGVTLQIMGGNASGCTLQTTADTDSDAPASYSDAAPPSNATQTQADFIGVGPYVEFDLLAVQPGDCTVAATEDTGLKRTFTFRIPIQSGGTEGRLRT